MKDEPKTQKEIENEMAADDRRREMQRDSE
jgi:hypothetical protein